MVHLGNSFFHKHECSFLLVQIAFKSCLQFFKILRYIFQIPCLDLSICLCQSFTSVSRLSGPFCSLSSQTSTLFTLSRICLSQKELHENEQANAFKVEFQPLTGTQETYQCQSNGTPISHLMCTFLLYPHRIIYQGKRYILQECTWEDLSFVFSLSDVVV